MRLEHTNLYLKQGSLGGATRYPFLLFIATCLFTALSPSFTFIPWTMLYDGKRIIQTALLLLAACWVLVSNQGTKGPLHHILYLPRLSRWSLQIICSLGFISSLQAPSIQHAILEFCLFILLISFALMVYVLTLHQSKVVIIALLTGIVVSAFAYEVTFFASYVGIFIQGNPLVLPEPFSGFSSIRFFNQFQIWTLPLIVLPLLLYPRIFVSIRWLLIVLAIGWWVLLFASQSRGAQVAIALAGATTLLIFRKDAWPIIKANLLAAISGWLTYYFLFVYAPNSETNSRLAQLTEDPARLQLWELALKMIADNPWLGIGPMHYAYYPNTIAAHPHNALLQIAAEWGIPVAIILVALTGWGVIAWCTKYFKNAGTLKASKQQHLWIALFYSLMAGLVYSMVSGVIVMPLSQTMFSVIAGLMLGLYYYPPTRTSTVSGTQVALLRFIAGTVTAGLLWTVIPDIELRMKMETPSSWGNVVTVGPRFWQQGGIPH